MSSSPRLLVIFTAATALVVGLVAALATNNWIFLPLALGAHAVGTVFVLVAIGKRLEDDVDKPDPVTEARLEEEARAG
jgi:hypothetical protein